MFLKLQSSVPDKMMFAIVFDGLTGLHGCRKQLWDPDDDEERPAIPDGSVDDLVQAHVARADSFFSQEEESLKSRFTEYRSWDRPDVRSDQLLEEERRLGRKLAQWSQSFDRLSRTDLKKP